MKRKVVTKVVILILILLCSIIISLLFGHVFINVFSMSDIERTIFLFIRLPRVLLACFVGAMLSLSGSILQSALKNPLADPYILGVSSGSAIGAAIAFSIGAPFLVVSLFSFLGAVLSTFIVYYFSKTEHGSRVEILVLLGVAISIFLSSILTIIVLLNNSIQPIYFWLFGSLSFANYLFVILSFISFSLTFTISIFMADKLNLLLLSDEEAKSLGLDVKKVRLIFILIASFLSAISVSMCGIIGFVGLIVPHISRFVIGGNNKYLLIISAMFGSIILVISDTLSRTFFSPFEIPIGVVLSFVGVPFLLYLILMRRYE